MVHHPLRLRLEGEALVSNWRWLRGRGGEAACGAAVKADGYGLGARGVVERLAAAGCHDFFVSNWAEAEALMPWAPELNLSVLHGVGPHDLNAALRSPARPVLNTPAQVARWRESAQGRSCDVMVDTGMNRLGLTPAEARSGMLDGLRVETLMSHLACADEPDHPMNERQLAAFRALRQDVPAKRYSLANSAGICLGPKYAFGLTRPGIALYGGMEFAGAPFFNQPLKSVVAVEAQVVQVRAVPAGGSVGYGATYVADADQQIAVLNIGYGDGYLRQLGQAGFARVDGRVLPIVGRISMDLIAVLLCDAREVTSYGVGREKMFLTSPRAQMSLGTANSTRRWESAVELAEGDWVELNFDLAQMSSGSGLTPYELLTTLGSRYERLWR